ncbi:MAG: tetratricopeptide repeat protein [Flavobacteriales bacterium]|nr:tetratricopeptide repeat protein [Flavobacteriales bacterium]NNK80981.1 tetratricopeptide repeat protein [Flavobacteriales bacterium]
MELVDLGILVTSNDHAARSISICPNFIRLYRSGTHFVSKKHMLKNLLYITLALALTACSSGATSTQSSQASNKTGKELSEGQKMKMTSLFIDAQKERMLGNLYAADKLLKQCLEIDPDNHAVLYDRALIAQRQGFTGSALEYVKDAISISPDNIWYKSLMAQLYLNLNEFQEAEKTYERIIEDHAQGFDYMYDLSMVRYRMGDIKGALEALDKIEEKMGFSEELFQQKQLLYMESGQTDKAIAELEEAISENPKNPSYYGMLAEVYERLGEKEKALEYYQKILEFDPENGMVQLSLYEYYMTNGEIEKAREAILLGFNDKLIDIDTKVGILLNYYELSESDPEKRDEALALCEQLVETYPDEAKAHAIHGDFLLREERLEESRESFKRAVEEDPSRQIIWSQILALDSELQDYESMRGNSAEALELFPANPTFYLLNGIANNQLGNHSEAVDILEAGKEMVFDDDALLVDFYSSIGDGYHQMEKYPESDKAFDKALSIAPDNVYVLNNFSYYLSLRKVKLEKAERMALKANQLSPNQASFEDTYAWVLFQNENYSEARVWIEKALSNGGSGSGVINEHYGDILFRLGEKDLAIQQWRKAKDLGDYSEFLEEKLSSGKIAE